MGYIGARSRGSTEPINFRSQFLVQGSWTRQSLAPNIQSIQYKTFLGDVYYLQKIF